MVERDFLLNALLCHNYLPTTRRAKEELPPFFSTESFTPDIARELAKLEYRKGQFSGYDQVEYKLTRFNSVGRLLSVPHPLPYAKLCLSLHESWGNFEYIASNPNSQIKPQTYEDGRVIIMNGYGNSVEKANHQLDGAFGMRYRVTTDITNCFPSIYSHAVPWALVGLETAKAQRQGSAWFNQIDKHLRSCKRDETQGVAIGPATSNIIAEAILARIDEELRKADFRFIRYIDDYCCHCETEERAQEFVRTVEREGAKFKLQLNIKKTEFARLPQPVTDSWVVELGRQVPNDGEWSAFETFRYLDYAVSLAERHPEGSVLKFAANVVSGAKFSGVFADAKALNYLLVLAFHRPELLPVLSELIECAYIDLGNGMIDMYGANTKLDRIAQENAKFQRSDGMCWALYHLGRVEAKISDETAQAIVTTRDAMAILALYWASDVHRDLVVAFSDSLDKEDLYELDRYWMLLYQLYVDGRVADLYGDKIFETLKSFGVNFLLPREEFLPKEQASDFGFDSEPESAS